MKSRTKKTLRLALLVAIPILIYQAIVLTRDQIPLKVGTNPGAFYTMALSPDGDTVCSASNSNDKRIHFWSYTRKRELFSLTQGDDVRSLNFSPSGRYLAYGGYHRFTLWDVVEKKLIGEAKSPLEVWDAKFSPDERTLVIAGVNTAFEAPVEIWQVQPLKKVRELPKTKGVIYCVDISPEGLVAKGNWRGWGSLWNLKDGIQEVNLSGGAPGKSNFAVAFSPDGKLVAMGGGAVNVWDVQTRKLLQTFPYKWNVRSLDFSSDGHYLAIGGDDHDVPITVWDVNAGTLYKSIQFRDRGVDQVKFWPNDSHLAVVSNDTLQLWRM